MVLFPHRGGRVTNNNVQYISKEAGLSSIRYKFKRGSSKEKHQKTKLHKKFRNYSYLIFYLKWMWTS